MRTVLFSLEIAESIEDFNNNAMPGWRVHQLSGERHNEWSIAISKNWRITFKECDNAIEQLNLEDYH
ncbi:MAG: type II toxin-antitoxin system RelE/ParE family toxin [Gammaproteobacteria bacterium]|nr:type II toxin-antitoxin system RelE/ParE family toxin [Gammaproteobacteria bacterium]